MAKFNPFRPGGVISPGMFVGRIEELETIEQALFQTKHGNPHHFIIDGERGIGKSSLCLYLDGLSQGRIKLPDGGSFNFITVNIELRDTMTYEDIVDAIILELKGKVQERQHLLQACQKAWDFLSRFQVAGVKYDRSYGPDETGQKLDEVTNVVVDLLNDAGDQVDGIFLLIDEADKPPAHSHLGLFSKLLTERLSRRGAERLCIGLSGLSDLLPKLKESHDSAPRIFTVLTLKPLEIHERGQVIDLGLDAAAKKNSKRVSITTEARQAIANLSEGYPHFLQEFASCSFARDKDDNIDIQDVFDGAFGENGALDQLGRKYFAGLYIDQIGSEEYRKVLMSMAEHSDEWVARPDIIEESGVKVRTVDNALRILEERKIILRNPEVRGNYKLPTKAFAVWIKAREAAKIETRPLLIREPEA